MLKAKLCGFAVACMVGLVGVSPATAIAAETNTESITLSENRNHKEEDRSAFEKKMKEAGEKWNALTNKQKNEVYSLLENEMQAEFKLMDKLVSLGVMQKADAENFKTKMSERFSKVKESGEFPLFRHNGKKGRK